MLQCLVDFDWGMSEDWWRCISSRLALVLFWFRHNRKGAPDTNKCLGGEEDLGMVYNNSIYFLVPLN